MSGWFAIIDGAQDPRLQGLVEQCSDHVCLYDGKLDPALAAVAPWLVRIKDGEPLMPTWQQHGRGKCWGIMIATALPTRALRKHLRQFLKAILPDGTPCEFRYYDPKVFNTYIRAATPEERIPWFEGVQQIAAETADGQALHQYSLQAGRLFDGAHALG